MIGESADEKNCEVRTVCIYLVLDQISESKQIGGLDSRDLQCQDRSGKFRLGRT